MYCVFIFRHIYIRNYFIFWYTDTLSLLSVLFIVLFLVRGSISSITTRKPPPDFSRLSSGWSKASVLALRVFSCQGLSAQGTCFVLLYPVWLPVACHWSVSVCAQLLLCLGLGPAHRLSHVLSSCFFPQPPLPAFLGWPHVTGTLLPLHFQLSR